MSVKKVRKLREVDLDKLTDERERKVRRKTKRHMDMRGYNDWAKLMMEKPNFNRKEEW